MDIDIDANGLYIVSFNHTVFNSCENDLDCPGQLVCQRNESWSAFPEMCTCPLTLGRTGLLCEDTNISGWILVAISGTALLIASGSLALNVRNLYKAVTVASILERVPKHSALFTTLSLTTVATLCISLQTSYQIASHFVARTTVLSVDRSTKQSMLVFFNLATTTLSFFFSVTATLNLSLVLLEISGRVTRGSSKIHVNVFVYRRFLIGYSLAFGIMAIIFAAIGQAEWTFVAAAPAVFFIAFTFLLGWFRLSKLFEDNKVASNKETTSKVNSALWNIRVTTLGVSLGAFGMICCGILHVFLDKYNRPDASFGAIPGRMLWIFASLIMLFMTRYTHVHINGKMGDKRPSYTDEKNMRKREDEAAVLVVQDVAASLSPGPNLLSVQNELVPSSEKF